MTGPCPRNRSYPINRRHPADVLCWARLAIVSEFVTDVKDNVTGVVTRELLHFHLFPCGRAPAEERG